MLSKQTLLDDIAWMLSKADEFGCQINGALKTRLEGKFYDLYDEIFRSKYSVTVHDYYQSWKLRGDKPELYRLKWDGAEKEGFHKKIAGIELERFDRYQVNDKVGNDLRKNRRYKEIYAAYHFNKQVRIKGSEITETELAYELCKFLSKRYPDSLKEKYEVTENTNALVMLEQIAQKRACRKKGGDLDLERAAILLLDDFRNAKIRKITLELPEDILNENSKGENQKEDQ